MRRVMVVGQPGSGKSTLARALGARAGLPVVHVDRIHWMPGWQARPLPEKVALARAAEAGEAWVIEGGLSATWDTRAARADLIVWLDRPLALRLWRVTRRLVAHWGESRPDLPPGCPEGWGPQTAEFWRYMVRTRASGRAALARLAAAAPCPVARLASDRAVAAFLAGWPRLPGAAP